MNDGTWMSDEVVQVREWGYRTAHKLEACADELGLTRDAIGWRVTAVCDGVYGTNTVRPGTEIEIKRRRYVAESLNFIRLRYLVQRLIGFGDKLGKVDAALRWIRLAATRRSHLQLIGETNLVSIAHNIHRTTCHDRPFITCIPRLITTDKRGVRSPRNVAEISSALRAARTGTLCMWSNHVPAGKRNVRALQERLWEPRTNVQLVICSPQRSEVLTTVHGIYVPKLVERQHELANIVEGYFIDAQDRNPSVNLLPGDVHWVVRECSSSHAEIETAVERIFAIRATSSIAEAARRLGMAPPSLAAWLSRRASVGASRPRSRTL